MIKLNKNWMPDALNRATGLEEILEILNITELSSGNARKLCAWGSFADSGTEPPLSPIAWSDTQQIIVNPYYLQTGYIIEDKDIEIPEKRVKLYSGEGVRESLEYFTMEEKKIILDFLDRLFVESGFDLTVGATRQKIVECKN